MSEKAFLDSQTFVEEVEVEVDEQEVKRIRRKVDIRLCTIVGKFHSRVVSLWGNQSDSDAEALTGVLCCLNIVDGGTISSASVAGLLEDLQLEDGNRYSVAIFIFTLAQVMFSLPATICVRLLGPRASFAVTTFFFGAFTIVGALSVKQALSFVNNLIRDLSIVHSFCTYLETTHRSSGFAGSGNGQIILSTFREFCNMLMVYSGRHISWCCFGDFKLVYQKYVFTSADSAKNHADWAV